MDAKDQVRQALYSPVFDGQMTASGVAIASNSSAVALEDIGPQALHAIETVLIEEQDRLDLEESGDRVASVFNSYFIIAHRQNYAGAYEFLLNLKGPLREIGILEICGLWGPSSGPNRLQPKPAWLFQLARDLPGITMSDAIRRLVSCVIDAS